MQPGRESYRGALPGAFGAGGASHHVPAMSKKTEFRTVGWSCSMSRKARPSPPRSPSAVNPVLCSISQTQTKGRAGHSQLFDVVIVYLFLFSISNVTSSGTDCPVAGSGTDAIGGDRAGSTDTGGERTCVCPLPPPCPQSLIPCSLLSRVLWLPSSAQKPTLWLLC